eukprot:Hpha_TRINITY_DN15687_c2_g1::TRINITY_DN15687_c2_g1_i1::g.99065::m.99065
MHPTIDQIMDHMAAPVDSRFMAGFLAVQAVWWFLGVPFWYYAFDGLFGPCGWYQKVKEKRLDAAVLTQCATNMYYIQASALMLLGVLLADRPGGCYLNNAFWYGLCTQLGHDLQDLVKVALDIPRYPHTSILPAGSGKSMLRRTVVLTLFHHLSVFCCCYMPTKSGVYPGIDLWWLGAPGAVILKNTYIGIAAVAEANGVGAELMQHLHAAGFVAWTLPRVVVSWDALVVAATSPQLSIIYLVLWGLMGYTIFDNSRSIYRKWSACRATLLEAPVRQPSLGRAA